MTKMQWFGLLILLISCPCLGGLPLINWITRIMAGKDLNRVGTGNISVSAAFYHGGNLVGILAVLSEAAKGIFAVLLARYFFGYGSAWELFALILLVLGRYFIGRGAGTTNVVWGMFIHAPAVAGLVFLISGITFTIIREKKAGKLLVLVIFPVIFGLLHPYESFRVALAVLLSLVLALIYQVIPDDLNLSATTAKKDSQTMFRFFQGDKSILSLDRTLDVQKVGQKAANLAQLKAWGYPIPQGWVLPPGDDFQPLLEFLEPNRDNPLIVRSSALGEDSESASGAGQYVSILNVTTPRKLEEAINDCFASYDTETAQDYRQKQQLPEQAMAVVIQKQIRGIFSGVAFSRDPVNSAINSVVIEALPGDCSRIVSGAYTPEQYQVVVPEIRITESWQKPNSLELQVDGTGHIPRDLIEQVAYLCRHLEARYHGIPQDIEWTYDGTNLWLLQARTITTLSPLWTRKIAAEVIPGLICPLTWSINRPLTCGVWGSIFQIVLGKNSSDLDFNQTATLHYSRAYFNATLLGKIFRRMGLPAESLEFLTRGAKLSKPALSSTLKQLPGLLKLLNYELNLERDFAQDNLTYFQPLLNKLNNLPATDTRALLERIEEILEQLKRVTYYSILAPLSFALRQAIFKVDEAALNYSKLPEVAAVRTLETMASQRQQPTTKEIEEFVAEYGYLSDVATDIAVPRWRENPAHIFDLLSQFKNDSKLDKKTVGRKGSRGNVQKRLNLKGAVATVYNRLLAELRGSFLALEKIWLRQGILAQEGDIFYLQMDEIRQLIFNSQSQEITELIAQRKDKLELDRQLNYVPFVVYGNAPQLPPVKQIITTDKIYQGIGASVGVVEGKIKIVQKFSPNLQVDKQTILVVPYTDAGWAPLLAQAGGIIAVVGGRLSHGAIVAREYQIPAVMDIENAMEIFQDGQIVKINGSAGVVEIK